jgi:hypothetical protein
MNKPDNLLGEVVSRATMAIVALAMLIGGFKCLSLANRIRQEYIHSPAYDTHQIHQNVGSDSGANLPAMIGIGLLIVGGFFLLAAVVPVELLSRLVSPPTATLYDGAEEDQDRGIANFLRFFGLR